MLAEKELVLKQEKLEILKKQRENMCKDVEDYLNTLLSSFTTFKLRNYIDLRSGWSFDKTNWEVYCDVNFINEKEEKDFASDFNIRITDKYLKINHGCCGDYSTENKYLVERLRLMLKVFENDTKIIKELDSIIDIEISKNIRVLQSELDNHFKEIKENIKKEKELKVLEQLKNSIGKYLVNYTKEYNYKTKQMDYMPTVNNYRIEKITNKLVKVTEIYVNFESGDTWDVKSKTLKLDTVIYDLINNVDYFKLQDTLKN